MIGTQPHTAFYSDLARQAGEIREAEVGIRQRRQGVLVRARGAAVGNTDVSCDVKRTTVHGIESGLHAATDGETRVGLVRTSEKTGYALPQSTHVSTRTSIRKCIYSFHAIPNAGCMDCVAEEDTVTKGETTLWQRSLTDGRRTRLAQHAKEVALCEAFKNNCRNTETERGAGRKRTSKVGSGTTQRNPAHHRNVRVS